MKRLQWLIAAVELLLRTQPEKPSQTNALGVFDNRKGLILILVMVAKSAKPDLIE